MDKLYGMLEKSLTLSEHRASLLAANLVNASTPNYKAKDIDFNKVMQGVELSSSLSATSEHHIKASEQTTTGANVQYRVPMQSSMDGNTVDPELERKNFLENSLKYQVSLTFIQNKTETLMKAIKGE